MKLIIDDHNEADLSVADSNEVSIKASDVINIAVRSYNKLDDKPSIEGVELVGDVSLEEIGAATEADIPTKVSQLDNDAGYTDFSGDYNDLDNKPVIPSVPTNVSAFNNDAGYITTESDPTVPAWAKQPSKPSYTAQEVGALPDTYNAPVTSVNNKTGAVTLNASDVGALPSSTQIPSKVSQLTNDSGFITTETDPTVPSWAKAQTKPSYTASEVGALPDSTQIPSKTSDLINDSDFITGLEILSYGNSTWQNFIDAYDAKKVVYCRASSNSNPATGSQTRLAFMAYVNNAETPTEVEFQYYRSVSSHTASQQGDQVFVYKLTKTGGWTVTTREASSKVATGSGLTSTYANDTITLSSTVTVPTKTSDLINDSNFTAKSYVDAQDDADRSRLYYGQVDATSTNVAFTAQINGITEYFDGLAVMLKNGIVTSAAGFTIDINGLGAKAAYSNMAAATAETTIFNVNYTMLFVYDSTRVEGGGWICYRGYNSDNNTIGYQIRTNSATLPLTKKTYRYRLLFTSADGTHYVPANASTSTNATAKRDVCQDAIDPFGRIVYYSSTSVVDVDARPGAASLWDRYALAFGYSFNRTGAALTMTSWKPVYLKCTPQSNGSAIMDATTPYVQDLPSTADGKIYIHLGVAYSATNIELSLEHPVYYYADGAIRLWTNPQASGGGGGLAVTITRSGDYDTCDKTAQEIKDVFDAGGAVVFKYTQSNTTFYLSLKQMTYTTSSQAVVIQLTELYSSSTKQLTCTGLSSYPSYYNDR